jgi:hypothetical protein
MATVLHTCDADCEAAGQVDPETHDCGICGVVGCAGHLCPGCGFERFHAQTCPLLAAEEAPAQRPASAGSGIDCTDPNCPIYHGIGALADGGRSAPDPLAPVRFIHGTGPIAPGAVLDGRLVRRWSRTNTGPEGRRKVFASWYTDVRVCFQDLGEDLYAVVVTPEPF